MLEVNEIRKKFGDATAVDGVTFSQSAGDFTVLLGPSGCGKTTTLRAVAGLERLDAGRISLVGKTVDDPEQAVFVAPDRRQIGMVFQSYALWPHMTVTKNVEFPLRVRGVKRREASERVQRSLESVGLGDLGRRQAGELSGGQQQRVALARALVYDPAMLLLDEPLSNLDAELRDSLRFELKELQRDRGVTTLYVTHDQAEAVTLGDVVIVMNQGKILQRGSPQEIYSRPASSFVARFTGVENLLPGTVIERRGGTATVGTAHGLRLAGSLGTLDLGPGDACLAAVRGRSIEVTAEATSADDVDASEGVLGAVRDIQFVGTGYRLEITVKGHKLIASVSQLHPDLAVESEVRVRVRPDAASIIEADEGHTAASAPSPTGVPSGTGI